MKKTTIVTLAIIIILAVTGLVSADEGIFWPRIELTIEEATVLIPGTWIETGRLIENGEILRTSLFNSDEILWTYTEDGRGVQTFTIDNELIAFNFSWKVFEDEGKLWIETSRDGDYGGSFIDELIFFNNNQHIVLDSIGVFDDVLLDGKEIGVLGWIYERVREE